MNGLGSSSCVLLKSTMYWGQSCLSYSWMQNHNISSHGGGSRGWA